MARKRLAVLSSLAALAGTVLIATPAEAASYCVSDAGGDTACIRNINSSRPIVDSCDREEDGHRVRAWYELVNGRVEYGEWDPNGAKPGCGHAYPYGAVDGIRICEEVVGCSPWRYF